MLKRHVGSLVFASLLFNVISSLPVSSGQAFAEDWVRKQAKKAEEHRRKTARDLKYHFNYQSQREALFESNEGSGSSETKEGNQEFGDSHRISKSEVKSPRSLIIDPSPLSGSHKPLEQVMLSPLPIPIEPGIDGFIQRVYEIWKADLKALYGDRSQVLNCLVTIHELRQEVETSGEETFSAERVQAFHQCIDGIDQFDREYVGLFRTYHQELYDEFGRFENSSETQHQFELVSRIWQKVRQAKQFTDPYQRLRENRHHFGFWVGGSGSSDSE